MNNTERININKIRTSKQLNELDLLEQQLKKIEKKYELANKSYLAEIDAIEEYKANKERLKEEEDRIIQEIETMKKEKQLDGDTYSNEKLRASFELLQSDELSIIEKHKVTFLLSNK